MQVHGLGVLQLLDRQRARVHGERRYARVRYKRFDNGLAVLHAHIVLGHVELEQVARPFDQGHTALRGEVTPTYVQASERLV